ncbi:Error-prone DNA polymerase [Corynebacterium rouxii]|uniref:Error-prone DNA polymerase n=1 Tax=Corynebacterium rouxii TaxID=2719119 RepID=A0A6I8MAF3_9CORY|nr:Error-prone DNA polymerase [Corynebacterium rouxii]
MYYSAWFKYHHSAEFYVGLLRAQPMGFYLPQSLLADARRKELSILSVNINKSDVEATVENGAIRLGLNMVKGLGSAEAEKIVADIAATGVGSDNPVALLRRQLELRGVIPASKLMNCENARRIFLAGVVTHRQRPQTAAGVTFWG